MSYKELYDYCQSLTPKISRNDLRDKVLSITGVDKIQTCKTTLDTTICRGFYLSPRNTEHRLVQQHGGHLIVLARGMNYCWDRFVFVKELMHLFDSAHEATNTSAALDRVMTELVVPGATDRCAQTTSEISCFWMALAAFCPEEARKDFEAQRKAGHLDDYAIALQLRIPKQYIPFLFDAAFQKMVNALTDNQRIVPHPAIAQAPTA